MAEAFLVGQLSQLGVCILEHACACDHAHAARENVAGHEYEYGL